VTTPSALAEVAGSYHSDEVGSTWMVVAEDGKAVLRRHRFP
jgi:hypothetical protein